MQLDLNCFDGSRWGFEAINKSFEGGSVNSFSLANDQDNKWLDFLVGVCDAINESIVYVNFLLCGYLWETVMTIGELYVVEFDVGSRFVGKGIVGQDAFYEKNVRPKGGGQMHGVEGHMQRSSQCGTELLLEVVEKDLPIITVFVNLRLSLVSN